MALTIGYMPTGPRPDVTTGSAARIACASSRGDGGVGYGRSSSSLAVFWSGVVFGAVVAAVPIGAVQVVAEAGQCQRPDPFGAAALRGQRVVAACRRPDRPSRRSAGTAGLLVGGGQAAVGFDQPPGGVQRTAPHLVQKRPHPGEPLRAGPVRPARRNTRRGLRRTRRPTFVRGREPVPRRNVQRADSMSFPEPLCRLAFPERFLILLLAWW